MLLETLDLTPDDFMKIPKQERALLVLLGHATNEITVLTRLFVIAGDYESQPRWYAHGQQCQALVLARTLTGKMHEVWQFITTGYLRTPLSKKYLHELDADGAAALSSLKTYFGRKNLITKVRNHFAFHYSLEHASTPVSEETPAGELRIYFGPTNGTSLYQFSEQIMGVAMLATINESDPQAAFAALLDETTDVTGWLNAFSQSLMYLILQAALGQERLQSLLKTMKASAPASASRIRLPYFAQVKPRRVKGIR